MATLEDLGVSAFINILSAFVFLLLFAVLRIQPVNDRVYFPKLYLAHLPSPISSSLPRIGPPWPALPSPLPSLRGELWE
jgi:hypothetical protein